jgi:ATP adenylyltransferase
VAKAAKGRCFFCTARKSRRDRNNLVVARTRQSLVMLNRYPYNNGHILVAPLRHTGEIESLSVQEWMDLWRLVVRFSQKLKHRMRAQGFNIGINAGRAGGAGVPGHVHLHVVPRWSGDTNFMPVLAKTKVISQSLDELYGVLADKQHG